MKPSHLWYIFRRLLRHLFSVPWHTRRHFTPTILDRIELAIRDSERTHTGEIRFVVESELPPMAILRNITPRQRATALFAELGVWDTAQNNGVLIYLLLADRDVEIVADRGIHHHVGNAGWEQICREMEALFREERLESGLMTGIALVGAELAQTFPASGTHINELPDAPVVL